jgi:hypothetical protein
LIVAQRKDLMTALKMDLQKVVHKVEGLGEGNKEGRREVAGDGADDGVLDEWGDGKEDD